MRTFCLALCALTAIGCGRDSETYRISANLVPSKADTCEECSVQLALEAVPIAGGRTRYFYVALGNDVGFVYRWGMEQTVEFERWKDTVLPGVADDSGERARMLRVLGSEPVAGTTFELAFHKWPPGTFGVRIEREGARLRLTDDASWVLIDCLDPALCDQVAGFKLGNESFVMTLAHGAVAGEVTLKAVRAGP